MLKHLRNKSTQKKIYIVLACLVIPSFFVGLLVVKGGNEKNAAGTLGLIDGRKVSFQDYLQSYRAVTHQAQFMYGDRFEEAKRYLNFKGEAWDRLLLLRHAKDENIRVSDQEVVDWITSQPLFVRGGAFDEDYYKRYIQSYLQMRERDFEEEIRQMLLLAKVRDHVKTTTRVDEEEVRRAYDRRFGEKSLVYGLLPWEDFKDKVKVEDAAVEQIYPVVKNRLTEPDKIKLRFVAVPRDKAAAAKAVKGTGLDAVAASAGVKVEETPLFSKNDPVPAGLPVSPQLLSAAFALKTGEESDWIDLDDASYKLALAEKAEGRTLTLEEAKSTIRQLILRQNASQAAVKKLQELKPRLEKEGFEKVLKDEKIDVRTLDRYKSGDALPGLGETEQVERALSDLKEGQVSEPIQGPAGAAIAKIVKEAKADAKAYEAEKTKFRKSFEDEKTDEAMKRLVERLRKRLKIDTAMMEKVLGASPRS